MVEHIPEEDGVTSSILVGSTKFNKEKALALEIERRFLVKPEHYPYLKGIKGYRIQQGYVSSEGDSLALRIRASTDYEGATTYFLTIKRRHSAGVNKEFEMVVSETLYSELLEECGDRIINKDRKFHLANGLIFEVDFFLGKMNGVCIAEVELKDINQSITLPDFIGTEITDLNGVSNFEMAVDPVWAKEILCQLN